MSQFIQFVLTTIHLWEITTHFVNIFIIIEQISVDSRKYWLPIWEENKVMGAMENHVHNFKRTHPLVNENI